MFNRHLRPAIQDALADTPAVMVVGARQTGKTTLVRALADERSSAYVTLDDLTVLDAAKTDPEGFVAALAGHVVIDEIQKAPNLLSAIKAAIDRDRRPGRFLLTGSANVLTLPRVSESLAGRLEVATLWPLSQGELAGRRESFVDVVLHGDPPTRATGGENLVPLLLHGGYPEAHARRRPDRRRAFFEAYVTTILTRDVRDVAAIEDTSSLRRLLQQLAAFRSASLLNHSELARTLTLTVSTLKRYLALLETLFLVHEVPAWASNRGKRLVRAPKLHLADTGLLVALARLDEEALQRDRTLLGPILESFVVAEISKQVAWSSSRPALYHFRTHAGQEVDLVLEDARGRVVGIEVKASATVTSSDLNGLRTLAETAGKDWVQGIVLYLGPRAVRFAPALSACPVEALWA